MTETSTISAAGLILAATVQVWGAPPEVTSLFPAGACRGTSTSITIQGKLGNGACHVWCSRPGINVAVPEKPGDLQIEVAATTEPGVGFIRFFNDDGATGLRPFVIGTCHEINEVESNDDVSKAQLLSELPVVVNGQHGKSGDTDSFAVLLKQGQTLVASLMANRVLGSPQDAVLQVLGPDGFVREQNEDDQGIDPQLSFTAPADGLYKLRTWAFPAAPDSSIRLFGNPACVYRLLVTTGPFVDHVLPAAVQAGIRQRIHPRGWNLSDEEMEIEPPVSAIHRRFEWPLTGWNRHFPAAVFVEPHPVTIEHEPNELAQPQSISSPVSITGCIGQPRDIDAYQFTGRKGQRLRFEIMARDIGSPLDPVLRLYDSSGKLLKEADDDGKQSVDPDIEFTLPADGDYRASITDRFLHHGERFVYVLTITEPQPDFSLSLTKDAYVMKLDAELEIPVSIARSFEFSEAIVVGMDGLPSGVSAEPVTSESKGDSSKSVKLKLKTAGPAAFSGPIRIWGRAANGSGFERSATFSMKAFGSATADLWLTVKK